MSDEWCAAHQEATVARCPEKGQEPRVAVNAGEHVAGTEVAATD